MCGAQAAKAQAVTFTGTERPVGSGFSNPFGVAVDGSGDVFVADTGNGLVREILAVGGSIPPVSEATIITLGSGFSSPAGVAVDGSGNVFVADSGNNAVKEILAVGGSIPATNPTINILGSGFTNPTGVAVDSSGNVFVADSGNNAVKVMVAVGGSIPANPTINVLGAGFGNPTGVAVDKNDDVFLTDTDNGLVRVVPGTGGGIPPPTTTVVVTLGGGFGAPIGIAVDGSGDVFVGDSGNGAVYEFLAVGGTIPVTNQTIITVGGGFAPNGVAVDGVGNVFVADTGNSQIEQVPPPNVNFGSLNVCPAGQSSPAPCSGTLTLTYNITASGTLGTPQVLTFGTPNLDFTLINGNTCTGAVAAGSNCAVTVNLAPSVPGARKGAVQIVDGSGNVLAATDIYGMGIASAVAFSPSPQAVIGSGFVGPAGMAVDGKGNLFVADFSNAAVEEVLAADGYTTVKVLGGGFFFGGPEGIALDGNGNVFVADYSNAAVYEILAAGGYTTVVPLASNFSFDGPSGIAVDGNGNVFLTDFSDASVDEILAAGGYSTVIQLAKSFTFGAPNGMAMDGSGNLFLADSSNGAVYEILAAENYTTVVSLGSGFGAPLAVAVDAGGNAFVTDVTFNTVMEILATGNYTTVVPLGTGFDTPSGVAVDPIGDVFVSDPGIPSVQVIERSQVPNFSFAFTNIGSTSSDSPKSAQFENIGNQPLTGAATLNDSLDFTVITGPGTVPDCDGVLSLSPGAQCNVSFSFTPQSGGPIASTFTLSDNSLNGSQAIQLSGTAPSAAQTITGISPNYGAPAALIVITGTNFGATRGNSSVTVGGAPAYVLSWSNTAISIQVPSKATTGNIVVTVAGTASNGVAFTFFPYPAITAISPATGAVGTPVTITGTGLMDGGGSGIVTFNGTPATILSQSSTSIQVNVPAGATSGPVSVHANSNTVKSFSTFTVTGLQAISGISPNYGSPAALIKITGTNFGATQGSSTVTVGGPPSFVISWSNTTISIQVPSKAATGNIVANAVGGSSNGAPFTFFPYPAIGGLSATSGPVGTPVTITGTGLMDGGGNGSVTFNGTLATILSQSSTSIQVNVPPGATSGPVRVHANGNTVTSPTNFTVTVPQIAGISPNYGSPAALIKITGNNFGATQGSNRVTVGGAPAYIVSWSDTAISIQVPSNAATGNIVVAAGGLSSNGLAFSFHPYPAVTGLSPTSGPIGTPVTITGTGLMDGGGNGTVTLNGTPATILSQSSTSIQVSVPAGATTGPVRVHANGNTVTSPTNFTATP